MYVQSLAHGAVQIDASAIHGGLGVVFDRKRRRWVLRAFSDGLRRDDYAVFDLAEGHSRDELVR